MIRKTLEIRSGEGFMPMDNHKRDWDELGELDPFWAVLGEGTKRTHCECHVLRDQVKR